MFSNCYLLQILSWIKFTHIIERSSWLCYVIKTFHTVKLFLDFPKEHTIMCLRNIFMYLDMNSIYRFSTKRLVLAARSVIYNKCLKIQNSLPMLKMHYQCTEVLKACEKFHVLVKQTVSWSFLFHIRTYQSWFFAHVRLFFMLHI